MSRFKRTEILQFPSTDQGDSQKGYWGQLGEPLTIQEYGAINTVHMCPTNTSLAACTAYSKVQLYNVDTMELHKSITKFKDMCFSGRWRRDGGLLCAGTGEGVVKVFDVNTKTLLRVLSGHKGGVQACDFVCDRTGGGTGTGVVSWSDDKTVKIWDLPTESVVNTYTGHEDYVRAGAVSVDQPDLVVSGGYDHRVLVWDRRGGEGPTLTMDHGAPVEAVLVLPGGGLVASAGGSLIKIWDMVGGRLLASVSPHHKTVTSLCVSGGGKCLVSGSLDRQVVWTDLATFRQVFNKQTPASVMSIGVGGRDNCLVVGMLDGLVQVHKRKEDNVVDGMRVDTKRYKKAKSHKYLKHTQFTPSPGDLVVGEGKRDIELRHDFLLRKFEYSKALDAVLKPYVARRKPEYTYSLMMELVRREGLKGALAGREEKQLCSVLQFVNKYLADSRFSAMMLHVANLLIELYLPEHGMSSSVDTLFNDMKKRLDREVRYMETLMELQGAVDLVLSAGNRDAEKPSAVEHRVGTVSAVAGV
eukprot:GFUD01002750.1.p1 GENE.GFUD01002750.1~~GFUD01002750.1.p1  ORF type:complete len:527 (+),score=157.54 GFUD01002750.1:830-2410(+)